MKTTRNLLIVVGIVIVLISCNINDLKRQALPTAPACQSIQSKINAGEKSIIADASACNEKITLSKDGITLVANGKVTVKQIYIPGNNNTVRGFTIADPIANNGFQVSGNFNLIENNEIYHTKQDGIWFFGHDNTFRNNYIHDILAPSAAGTNNGDPHVDCFQTWDWSWDTYNVLIDGNTCDHTRASQSNQIIMLSGSRARDITIRNNRFIMHDAGYSPLALYGGTGFTIQSNYFCNTTGKGTPAIYLDGGKNVAIDGNTWAGYSALVQGSGVISQDGNIKGALPCEVTGNATGTPTATRTAFVPSVTPNTPASSTPVAPTATFTPTRTATATPSRTSTATQTSIPTAYCEQALDVWVCDRKP